MAQLEKQGYSCYRSAGSHTLFDAVCIPKKADPEKADPVYFLTLGIQFKSTQDARPKKYTADVDWMYSVFNNELEELRDFQNTHENVKCQLWVWLRRIIGKRNARWVRIEV